MSIHGHGCSPLCDACLEQQLGWHRGTAQSRGDAWARAIARVVPIDKPWPTTTERMWTMALRKVSDLTRDARLRDLLAEEVIVGARR